MSGDTPTHPDAGGISDPYAERIAGETDVTWQCAVAANDEFDPADPEYCPHEPETVTLDEPASIDGDGKIQLPGRPVDCPECGNPYEFLVNRLVVTFV